MDSKSKAAMIREVLEEMGDGATFKAVEKRLRSKGVQVTPQQVSNEKKRVKSRLNVDDLPVSMIRRVKELVDEVGSPDVVRRALDELEMLVKDRKSKASPPP